MKANAMLSDSGFTQYQARRRIGRWNRRLAIALLPVAVMLAGQDASTHAARTRFMAQPRTVAAYYDSADRTRHALVAGDSHTLTEVYWSGNSNAGKGMLATFAGTIGAVAGYYDSADDTQHAIVATGGTVTELFWRGGGIVSRRTLTTFAGRIVGIGAYYDSAENTQHAIVATGATLTEVYWGPTVGIGRGTIATFPEYIDAVAGYYNSAENSQHAIAATDDGKVTEVYWGPTVGKGRGTLATFTSPIIAAVAGYYDSADDSQHVIVATDSTVTAGGIVTELYWRGGGSLLQDTLATRWDAIVSVGGFYAPDDNSQHVVIESYNALYSTNTGSLYDVFWQTGAPQIRFLAT